VHDRTCVLEVERVTEVAGRELFADIGGEVERKGVSIDPERFVHMANEIRSNVLFGGNYIDRDLAGDRIAAGVKFAKNVAASHR
jgi:hypothetical protein